MKIPKRQVRFLTKEEVHKLLDSISAYTKQGLRMKALMTMLLVSGMRISELLSLNKDDIDWERKEAVIIGKGNKSGQFILTTKPWVDCELICLSAMTKMSFVCGFWQKSQTG